MNYNNLQNIQNALNLGVKNKKIVGASCLVFHDGKERGFWHSGFADVENKKEFSRNTIIRLYSMSKPVTSVAAMILIERGILDFTDEVSQYIPEFADLTVCKDGKIQKSSRPLLIQDLLNMTSGYTYGGNEDEGQKQTSALLWELNQSVLEKNDISTLEVAKRLAKIPVSFEPGTDYQYGLSADIMGAVIEVASGMKYSEFLKKEIFEPLGMNDTGFFVPQEKLNRLAKVYSRYDLSLFTSCNLGIQDKMNVEPAFESGGAGLVSTIDDYMKFCIMLVSKGIYNGKRILQEKTVEYLSRAKLRDNLQKCFDNKMEHWAGYSYANFMRVCVDSGKCASMAAQNNEFGWDGWLGPFMAIDLENKLAFVYFQQMTDTGFSYVSRRCKNIIYSSLLN